MMVVVVGLVMFLFPSYGAWTLYRDAKNRTQRLCALCILLGWGVLVVAILLSRTK